MRAQLLTAFGDTSCFQLAEAPTPNMTRDQVLIEVAAIGVNSLETKIRSGALREHFPTSLPAILGKEVAGTVVRVGERVTSFRTGDRVAGFVDSGAYAALAVARPVALAPILPELSFEQAASLPVAVETATRSLAMLNVSRAATVVVNGASGAVGSAAVQLLAMQGATVIGIASSPNHAYLRALGAIPVAYGDGIAERIQRAAAGPIAAVFDVAGHGFAATAIALTGDPARVVTIADFAAAALGVRTSVGRAQPVADALLPVLPLAAAGAFQLNIERTFPLHEIAAAHALVEGGHVRGKVIVRT